MVVCLRIPWCIHLLVRECASESARRRPEGYTGTGYYSAMLVGNLALIVIIVPILVVFLDYVIPSAVDVNLYRAEFQTPVLS